MFCADNGTFKVRLHMTSPKLLHQMQLLSRSFADIVLREREERKRGGKGMAEGGGDRLGGTEMMDGVLERAP